jgi:hypothetical protein
MGGAIMSSILEALPGGRYQVILADEPPYCHALPMAPSERESMLNDGQWLVLVIAVWNCQEVIAMDAALAAIKPLSGTVKLGIRPMFDPKELASWCPEALNGKPTVTTPLWLIIDNGQLLDKREGELSTSQISSLLQQFVTASRNAPRYT